MLNWEHRDTAERERNKKCPPTLKASAKFCPFRHVWSCGYTPAMAEVFSPPPPNDKLLLDFLDEHPMLDIRSQKLISLFRTTASSAANQFQFKQTNCSSTEYSFLERV